MGNLPRTVVLRVLMIFLISLFCHIFFSKGSVEVWPAPVSICALYPQPHSKILTNSPSFLPSNWQLDNSSHMDILSHCFLTCFLFNSANEPQQPKVAGENIIPSRQSLWLLSTRSSCVKSGISTSSVSHKFPIKNYRNLCLSIINESDYVVANWLGKWARPVNHRTPENMSWMFPFSRLCTWAHSENSVFSSSSDKSRRFCHRTG